MADGKVMQKYYPPDFDPEALRKNKDIIRAVQRERSGKRRRGPRMMEMRMMFPFTLQCENCKDFVYVGTKFNSKVERVRGEDYLGIAIWRFYGRCPHCRHQLILRTDPKNTDYVLESGGTRTYDSNRDVNLAEEALKAAREQEVEGDAVKALEIKSYSTAEELRTIEALDELRKINRRLMNRPDELSDMVLAKMNEQIKIKEDLEDEEDAKIFRRMFSEKQFDVSSDSEDEEPLYKKSKEDEEIQVSEDEEDSGRTIRFFQNVSLDINEYRLLRPNCEISKEDLELQALIDKMGSPDRVDDIFAAYNDSS